MDKYVPIACHFYDELEALAVKKIACRIVYLEENEQKEIEGKIVDFITKNKEEFLLLDNGFKLRLDYLVEINGKKPPKTC